MEGSVRRSRVAFYARKIACLVMDLPRCVSLAYARRHNRCGQVEGKASARYNHIHTGTLSQFLHDWPEDRSWIRASVVREGFDILLACGLGFIQHIEERVDG